MIKLAILMRNYSGPEWNPVTGEFLSSEVPVQQGGPHDEISVGGQAVETPQNTAPTPATLAPVKRAQENEREKTAFSCRQLKRLTPCRKKLVTEYLNESLKNPDKYHQAEGVTLLKKELLDLLRSMKSTVSAGVITSDDLNHWLKADSFASTLNSIENTTWPQSTTNEVNTGACEGNASIESTIENTLMETEISRSSLQYSDVSPEPDLGASIPAAMSTEENSFMDTFDTDRDVESYSYPWQNKREKTVFSYSRRKRLTPCRRRVMREILEEALKTPDIYHQAEAVTLLKTELLEKLRMRKSGSAGVITSDDLNHWLKQTSFVLMIKSIKEKMSQSTATRSTAINKDACEGNTANVSASATHSAPMETENSSPFVKYIPVSTIPDVGARIPATVSTKGYSVMNQFKSTGSSSLVTT